jgi:hypothetical protein
VSEMSPEEIEKLKHAPAVEGIPQLLLQRWSPRAFDGREIPSGDLEKLFVAASWAASSSNEQPWRFLLGRRGDETYKKIFDSLVEFNQMWAKTAPVLVLSVAKKTFTQKGNPNDYALHDTGAATAYLGLAATAFGLQPVVFGATPLPSGLYIKFLIRYGLMVANSRGHELMNLCGQVKRRLAPPSFVSISILSS